MRLLAYTLLAALAAYAVGIWMTVYRNPEIAFWKEVVERRDAEIAEVRARRPDAPLIFFTGGSSCAFSIDPAIIEEQTGLPAFNLGLPVAAGGEFLIDQAFRRTRPGDILIVALEPDLLSYESGAGSPSAFSVTFTQAMGEPRLAGGGVFGRPVGPIERINLMRPGARFVSTFVGKVLLDRGYRYKRDDWRYHGRLDTPTRPAPLVPAQGAEARHLSQAGIAFLDLIGRLMREREVRVAYSMPWQFTSSEILEERRVRQRERLDLIRQHIPVLEDGFSGCHAEAGYFADSILHLSGLGSERRSHLLAPVLSAWLGEKPFDR